MEQVKSRLLLLVLVLVCLFAFYRYVVSACFDAPFAHTRGVPVDTVNIVLVMITSVAVVLAFKVVGIFLISALIIIPPVAALLISRTFKQVLWLASLFGVVSVWAGVYFSFVFDIPSGATIILVNLACLLGAYVWSKTGGLNAR